MKDRLKGLFEERAKVSAEQRALLDAAATEKRSMNDTEEASYDKLEARFLAIDKEIGLLQTQEERAKKLAESAYQQGQSTDKQESEEQRYAKVFESYLRFGMGRLSPEERSVMQQSFVENRAQSVGTNSAGGFTVPIGFSGELEKAIKYFGPMLNVGRTMVTSTGNLINWPTVNDTANVGGLIAENADHAASVTDVAFANLQLTAYGFTSGIVKVSNELLQDSAFDMSVELSALLGERLGRALNTFFTTGTGSSQPQGVVTGASAGITAGASAITADNLLDLQHSVDRAYRLNGRYMMNDTTLAAVRKLKDTTNQYLWQVGDMRTGAPGTIFGLPYEINNDMAGVATTNKSVLFGDFQKFVIRQALGIQLVRLEERFADFNQTGFLAISRFDSRVIQPAAIKVLAHA